MYKTSTDRRFQKNKKEIRQAFIRLVQFAPAAGR